jgi:hypothetical protein
MDEWKKEQYKYIKNLSKSDKLALIIYSETHFFKLLNKFCNQFINPKNMLEYEMEDKVEEYCNLKKIKIIDQDNTREYFVFIADLCITLTKDLINIIEKSPSNNSEIIVYRGTKQYYYSEKEYNIINYGFVSTSVDKEITDYFIKGGKCCLFNITMPKGSKGLYLSLLNQVKGYELKYDEDEVLLLPYSTFELIDKKLYEHKWYNFFSSETDEYDLIYKGYDTSKYDQFDKYKELLLAICFDHNIKEMINILENNPINMTLNLFKLINGMDMFTSELVSKIIIGKKLKVEFEYIIYSIKLKIDNELIKQLIKDFKEFENEDNFIEIVKASMKYDNVGIIKYISKYHSPMLTKYINLLIKVNRWLNKY